MRVRQGVTTTTIRPIPAPYGLTAIVGQEETLRAKIDETVLPVVITEQGEKRNQS
jgi:hypothetical protein